MRVRSAIAAVVATATVGVAYAAAATAQPPPRVVCGQVITASTTLTKNLRDCPGNGLVVAAANVTLDLGGFTVSGTGSGSGIEVLSDGVTVRNGTVSGFRVGVDGAGEYTGHHVGGGIVSGLTIKGNSTAGVSNFAADGWRIENNEIVQNADGVDFFAATNMTVSGNRIAGNVADGIYSISGSDNGTVSANTIVFNGGNGILTSNSTTKIVGNAASNNHVNGIALHEVSPGFADLIADNVANDNGELGITADFEGFDGGGNTAHGNGDPRECVNVVCS